MYISAHVARVCVSDSMRYSPRVIVPEWMQGSGKVDDLEFRVSVSYEVDPYEEARATGRVTRT